MKRTLIAIISVLTAAQVSLAATRVFEKADALYRPKKGILGSGVLFGHAAVYLNSGSTYRFSGAEADARSLPDLINADGLHSVLQTPGYGANGVEIVSFNSFLGNLSFWGAYQPPGGFDASQRQRVIWAIGGRLGTPYTLGRKWKSGEKFRCDGIVTFGYAAVGFQIPENAGGSWLANLPRTQRARLSLRTSAQAPTCQPATRTASGPNFVLSTNLVRDDASGSGVDRVEFYNGNPASGGILLGKDDHDSNPFAGLPASDNYSATSSVDPGANLYTRAYDQAGNFATCSIEGTQVGASDLAHFAPSIVEDVNPPTITNLEVKQESGGQTAKATWTPSDDQTPAASLNYFYAIDKPAEQWDDPDMTFLGQVATPEATLDISQLAEGEHTLDLVALDAEGNIGATSVNNNIAGRCFLVENEKLIFSHPATRNARNPAFHGIHYCETRAQCITAGGILAGVRACRRGGAQAMKMGLDASGTGVKLVRGARFSARQMEVSL